MAELDLESVKQRILKFLAKYPGEQFKSRSLARRLSMRSQAEYHLVQRALNELFQSQAINRGRKRRYGHATPPSTHHRTGILSITKKGLGTVDLEPPFEGTVTILPTFLGTALAGDKVSIALFAHPNKVKDAKGTLTEHLEGEIVEVIERSRKPIVGVFERGKNFFFVVPDDNTLHRDIYIPKGKTKGARPGEKVVAIIESWESRHLNPE
ncbi:MAG: hypothetical protein HY707_12600, partial [Ignavibacteriae bacterium]|nr:hypothetical protein [Ignavibacteriota bacterium]